VFPAYLDEIEYDGITKPPTGTKRNSGRPRTKRIQRRSDSLGAEEGTTSDVPQILMNSGYYNNGYRHMYPLTCILVYIMKRAANEGTTRDVPQILMNSGYSKTTVIAICIL
jgi:hypothetical protein